MISIANIIKKVIRFMPKVWKDKVGTGRDLSLHKL
jgi:hypothetical protein